MRIFDVGEKDEGFGVRFLCVLHGHGRVPRQVIFASVYNSVAHNQKNLKRASARVDCFTFACFAQISGDSRLLNALLLLAHRLWRFAHCFTQ